MNFIVWNCRGSKRANFRRNFRELLDFHKPALVVLLETHLENHQNIPQEFHFSSVIAVPGTSHAGGIAMLWHDDILNITAMGLTHQEIQYKIQAG
ncbi:hypothetical protein P3S68_020150 [Capsicum galapagoense]